MHVQDDLVQPVLGLPSQLDCGIAHIVWNSVWFAIDPPLPSQAFESRFDCVMNDV
jgi:hypothetical protein